MESDITAEEETLYKRRRRQSLELISSGNQALGEQINICVIIMKMYQTIIRFFSFPQTWTCCLYNLLQYLL